MTAIFEIEQEAVRLEAEARGMAVTIEAAGLATIDAETARVLVRNAELLATLVPTTEAEAHTRFLAKFEDNEVAAIESAAGSKDEAVQRSLARLELLQEEFQLWLLQHRYDAWRHAHGKLLEIVRAQNPEG